MEREVGLGFSFKEFWYLRGEVEKGEFNYGRFFLKILKMVSKVYIDFII